MFDKENSYNKEVCVDYESQDIYQKPGHFYGLTNLSRQPEQLAENRNCPGKTRTPGQPTIGRTDRYWGTLTVPR